MSVARGDLPPLPDDASVSAWQASLPEGLKALTPKLAMALMLHVSWSRWEVLAAMVEEQVRLQGAAGLVGDMMASGRGGLYATGSQVLPLTMLEAEERDRIARLAKDAHAMGLGQEG